MSKIKLEHRKPMTVAYIEHTGSYDELPFEEDIARLYKWASEHHVRPGFTPMGIYLDPPDTTPPPHRRTQIAIPIKGTAEPDSGVRVRELPEMDVASLAFKGPTSEFARAYAQLHEWTEKNGFVWAGAPIEVYTKKPKKVGSTLTIHAKLHVPVRKR